MRKLTDVEEHRCQRAVIPKMTQWPQHPWIMFSACLKSCKESTTSAVSREGKSGSFLCQLTTCPMQGAKDQGQSLPGLEAWKIKWEEPGCLASYDERGTSETLQKGSNWWMRCSQPINFIQIDKIGCACRGLAAVLESKIQCNQMKLLLLEKKKKPVWSPSGWKYPTVIIKMQWLCNYPYSQSGFR